MIYQGGLIARINRKLQLDGERLREALGGSDLGPFYVVKVETNALVAWGISDLETMARDLRVIS